MHNAYAILPWLADRLREYANAAIMLCIAAGAALTVAVVSAHGTSAPRFTQQLAAPISAPALPLSPAQPSAVKPLENPLAAVPRRDLGLAAPFIFRGSGQAREYAVNCLAAAAWYEAGSDPEGQRAVIQVVLNRLKHPAFPKTVCGVVFEGWQRPTGCQFTFTCDGSLQQRAPSPVAWSLARVRAQAALDGAIDPAVMQATHYHADYVLPWWSRSLEAVAKVGPHIFYRWPGTRGALNARPGVDSGTVSALLPQEASAIPGIKPAPVLKFDTDFTAYDNQRAALKQVAGDAPRSTDRAQLIELDPNGPSGRWAIAALNRCAGQTACLVLGYGSADLVARNRQLGAAQRDRPLFMFVRDRASGMELALWDCASAPRASPGQCQPAGSGELQRLMMAGAD